MRNRMLTSGFKEWRALDIEKLSLGELIEFCAEGDKEALEEGKRRLLMDFPDIGTMER